MKAGKIKTPFDLDDVKLGSSITQGLFSTMQKPLEKLLGLDNLQRAYTSAVQDPAPAEHFLEKALRHLDISYQISPECLASIPKTGPLLVVSNHPFGGLEGMVLAKVLSGVRSDFKIMANFLLGRITELSEYFMFVDPFGDAQQKNIGPMRNSVRWLKDGKALAVFPAGTVAHLHLKDFEIRDPDWSETVARIVRQARCPVLPVFFHGHNGNLFQAMGIVNPWLRTLMLPRELYNKGGKPIRFQVGDVIPYEKLKTFDSDTDLLAYMRLRTEILGVGNSRRVDEKTKRKFLSFFKKKFYAEVIPPIETSLMLGDIEQLPEDQVLIESNDFQVFFAHAPQIPNVLREIGRLREITFRKANEGTGKSVDLDRFDKYYTHLFLWNRKANEVVGAYRIGHTDLILQRLGRKGLYTSTLFDYETGLLEQFGPALELGRSFVRSEYQRAYACLLSLWKGIGAYVARDPKYKILFGPVSINNDYDSLSRDIIVGFLKENDYLPELAKLVKPKNPHQTTMFRDRYPEVTSRVVKSIDEVSELVAEIEADQRGVPVLLRQYLKLGGKLLGFNQDPNFGDVLDGLILVDFTQSEARVLLKYIGQESAITFLKYHGLYKESDLKLANGTSSSKSRAVGSVKVEEQPSERGIEVLAGPLLDPVK